MNVSVYDMRTDTITFADGTKRTYENIVKSGSKLSPRDEKFVKDIKEFRDKLGPLMRV